MSPASRVPSAASRAGLWRFGALAVCFALSACGGGGGNNATGPVIADLGGERIRDDLPALPAFDVSGAPTDAHRALAALLPLESLLRDSVVYGDWNAERAELSTADPARASLPVVSAEYQSAGFRVHSDDPRSNAMLATREYPQTCFLTLIRAPESLAAEAIARQLAQQVASPEKGFVAQDPLAIGISKAGERPTIDRFLRIDQQGDVEKVYVAYIKAIGPVVVYALEVEYPPVLKGPDGKPIKRVLDGQRGSRVGGALITLVHHKLNP